MTKQEAPEGKTQSSELTEEKRPTWRDVLLGDGPRFDLPIPKRGKRKSRKELGPRGNPQP